MKPSGFPLRAGADTLQMYIPYIYSWHVPDAQGSLEKGLHVYGEDWHASTIVISMGKFERRFWKLDIHSAGVYGLITAKNLRARMDAIFDRMDAPCDVRRAFYCNDKLEVNGWFYNIGFSRVDIATDYATIGHIPLTPDEQKLCEDYRRKVELYEADEFDKLFFGPDVARDSLYIKMPAGKVRQFRYDKRAKNKLEDKTRRYTARPCSRIERRFHGSDACKKGYVRTFTELLVTLIFVENMLQAEREAWRRARREIITEEKRRAISAHEVRLLKRKNKIADETKKETGGHAYNNIKSLFFSFLSALISSNTNHVRTWLYSHGSRFLVLPCPRSPPRRACWTKKYLLHGTLIS